MIDQQPKPPVTVQAVEMVVKVLTSDGRTHELEIRQDDLEQPPHVNYMGNNILVDKQLQVLLQSLVRTNNSLI